MTCEEYEIRIAKLLDDELRKEESKDIFAHLAACGGCSAWFHDQVRLTKTLARLPAINMPGLESVNADVRSDMRLILRSAGRLRASTLALLLSIVLFVAVLFSTSIQPAGESSNPWQFSTMPLQ